MAGVVTRLPGAQGTGLAKRGGCPKVVESQAPVPSPIKIGGVGGDAHPLPSPPFSCILFHHGKRKGRAHSSIVAARASPRGHTSASAAAAEVGSSVRGGAAGQVRDQCGACGRGGRTGALVVSPPMAPPPTEGHTGDTALEFIVELRDPLRSDTSPTYQ